MNVIFVCYFSFTSCSILKTLSSLMKKRFQLVLAHCQNMLWMHLDLFLHGEAAILRSRSQSQTQKPFGVWNIVLNGCSEFMVPFGIEYCTSNAAAYCHQASSNNFSSTPAVEEDTKGQTRIWCQQCWCSLQNDSVIVCVCQGWGSPTCPSFSLSLYVSALLLSSPVMFIMSLKNTTHILDFFTHNSAFTTAGKPCVG